jgi:hypothetical protein
MASRLGPRAASRHARAWLVAWLAALALVCAAVVSVRAADELRLTHPLVSPRTVAAGEPVTFEVTYKSVAGHEPDWVAVEVGGVAYPLAYDLGKTNPHAGPRYVATIVLPAVTADVRFVTMDVTGQTASVDAGAVSITGSDPGGGSGGSSGGSGTAPGGSTGSGSAGGSAGGSGSTPGATAPPSGGSTAPGSGSTAPGGLGTGSGGTTNPGITPGSGGAPDVSPDGAPAPTGAGRSSGGSPGGLTSPSTGGSSGPDPVPSGSAGTTVELDAPPRGLMPWERPAATAPDGGSTDLPGAGATGGGPTVRLGDGLAIGPGLLAGLSGSAAFGRPDSLMQVLPVLVTTFGGVAMVMAFVLFGKRRRDGEPTADDETLAAAAGAGFGAAVTNDLVLDGEMALPRWRRPSLLEARKADPTRVVATPVVLTFDQGSVGPLDGHERRTVRYAIVRLLDTPDEVTAVDVGTLGQGDEVQLLERSGSYWFVLCPDGRRGWVHRMVLGDRIEPDLPGPAIRATRARMSDGEAATLGSDVTADMEFDIDVLEAYRAMRARV